MNDRRASGPRSPGRAAVALAAIALVAGAALAWWLRDGSGEPEPAAAPTTQAPVPLAVGEQRIEGQVLENVPGCRVGTSCYRLTAVARDRAGNAGRPRTATFTVVAR